MGCFRLRKIIQRNAPDIVHTHLVQSSLIGRISGKISKKSTIITTQHNAFWPKEDSLLYRLERQTWGFSNAFIALSDAISKYLKSRGCNRPIHIIKTGIDFQQFSRQFTKADAKTRLGINSTDPVIGIVARLSYQKGFETLISATHILVKNFPKLRLLIVGEGALRSNILIELKKLALSENVRLLSEHLHVREIMEAFDIFILPSYWEGFGRVLLEAMALQIPVIATTVEGIPEIIEHSKTGILIPPYDIDALVNATSTLLNNPRNVDQLGYNGRTLLEKEFGIKHMIDEEERIYLRYSQKTNRLFA